jgi:predicted transcriptional regulator
MTRLSFEGRIDQAELAIVTEFMKSVPVKVGELARALGLEVVVAPLPLNISGSIEPRGNTFVIKVNRYEAKARQRFTIAHEIAHYLLHRDRISGGLVDSVLYRSKLASRLEAEANRLAADIIMPRDAIGELISEADADERVDRLAEKFNVSRQAAEIRLS